MRRGAVRDAAQSLHPALDSESNRLIMYMIIALYILDHNQVRKELTSDAKIGRKMVAVAVFEVTSVKVVIMTHTMITIA